MAGCHLGIGVDLCPFEPFPLNVAGALHPGGNGGRAFTIVSADQFPVFYCRDFNVNVDSIQQRAGKSGAVAVNFAGRAGA
jgi:hypothetical protein